MIIDSFLLNLHLKLQIFDVQLNIKCKSYSFIESPTSFDTVRNIQNTFEFYLTFYEKFIKHFKTFEY